MGHLLVKKPQISNRTGICPHEDEGWESGIDRLSACRSLKIIRGLAFQHQTTKKSRLFCSLMLKSLYTRRLMNHNKEYENKETFTALSEKVSE